MRAAGAARLLGTFAALELMLAALMFLVVRDVAIGASQVAIGMSLIAIAVVARNKKKSNG